MYKKKFQGWLASTLRDCTILIKEYLCLQIPVSKEFNSIYTVKEQMIHFLFVRN